MNSNEGAGYVIFGKESGLGNITLNSLPPGDGFAITRAMANNFAGISISSGDINGDGIDDVLIGANGVNSNEGAGYVIFGKESGLGNITLPPGSGDGFTIAGAVAGDFAGQSISSGDINGDGFDDALIGANRADANGIMDSGAGYVIFGKESGLMNMTLPQPLATALPSQER